MEPVQLTLDEQLIAYTYEEDEYQEEPENEDS